MHLHRKISSALNGVNYLSDPPRIEKTYWEGYQQCSNLLVERHVAALYLLEEELLTGNTSVYETPVSQVFLNDVLRSGVSLLRGIDADIKALMYAGGDFEYVTGYLDALHDLRRVVELTIKHYYRIKGSGNDDDRVALPRFGI